MLQLKIQQSDLQSIAEGRYTQLHQRVMQKYEALWLKHCGLSNQLICKILGICNNTLLSFYKQYNEGGLERIQEIKFHHPKSELSEFSGSIEKYFEENPPKSISEAAAKIEELTGIKRGETQVRKFLKDRKFRFRRVGTVPAKALTEEKKTSRENFWKRS
jgi:transposase